MAIEKILSGITSANFRALLNSNFAQLYPILVGTTDPISTMVGYVGQEYLNKTTGFLFICKLISGNIYTWEKIENNNLLPIIVNNTPPTTSTIAQNVSQQYLDTSNNGYYVCTSIANGVYIWTKMNNEYVLTTLVQATAPTTSTVSDGIGQLYINTSANTLYICTAISGDSYTWLLVTKETEINQVIINSTQPTSQRVNDYWFKIIS